MNSTTVSPALVVQKKLLERLVCPHTFGPVEVLPLVMAAGGIKEGAIWSHHLGSVVGRISNRQIDMVRFNQNIDVQKIRRCLHRGNLPRTEEREEVWQFMAPSDPFFSFRGSWRPIEDMIVTDGDAKPTQINFEISDRTKIRFGAHPWSGKIEIFIDDVPIGRFDLFEPHTTVPRTVSVQPRHGTKKSRVMINVLGENSPSSMGRQCLFSGCDIATRKFRAAQFNKPERVRGASFTNRFYRLLESVPLDGLCLDIGGGNRQIDDGRYANLDYAPYSEPDIIGDALRLPFLDCSIDFVYSSGVCEHLADPIRAGREICRVLKPGGKILIGMAFMQPVHSEGQHYFNGTIWGLEKMFPEFDDVELSWEGSLSYLINWLLNATHLERKARREDLLTVKSLFKEWDSVISHDRLLYIANGVWFAGTKPENR